MPASVQIPVTQTGLEASIQAALRNAGKGAQINLGTNSRQISALAQPLGRITGQADEFTKSMEAANARVFAFGASVGIINSVSSAFSSLVKNTIAVEKSLVEINSVFNKSSSVIEKFGNSLFDVAKNTGQSFDTVAKGALELARQGFDTEESLKRINDALILTRLSGMDAEKSVSGLTAAVNAFKSTGVTTAEVLNKLVNVSQQYSVSEKDLIEGLKRSASVAKQAGVSLDELLGVITAVQEKTSVGGAVIGNSFKTIFTRLQDTGSLEALRNLGVTVTDVQGKILPATKLLENLAVTIKGLNQIQVAEITEKIGGGFQIDKLLATLEDLSSESSVAFEATKISLESTNQAYQKNAALNVTLSALINKTALSAEQLGATLGRIGITDSAKNLLGFFNGLLESIQKILGQEGALGDVFRGLAKGIGNLITGPGLALFAAIILKLSKDLAQFGFASLKGFFGIGKAAKEIQNVEQSIASALSKNINLQRQLFALEGNRTAQIKVMSDAIVMQEAAMRRMASTASSLAAPLYQQGVRSSGEGLRVPKAAGGYMPAVAQESSDIKKGVGGAKAGDRPVVIPNFNFGQGKKGSIVAHTGEYAVPNFGGSGGTAIFNRDMVRSMGLPSGAKKITASGGLIPNFANQIIKTKEFEVKKLGNFKNRIKADSNDTFRTYIEIIRQQKDNSAYDAEAQRIAKLILPRFGKSTGKIIAESKLNQIVSNFKKEGVDPSSINSLENEIRNSDPTQGDAGKKWTSISGKIKGIIGEIDAAKLLGTTINQKNAFVDLASGEEVKTRKRQPISDLMKKVANTYLSNKDINNGKIDNITEEKLGGNFKVVMPIGSTLVNAAKGFIPNFADLAETIRQYYPDLENYRKEPGGKKFVFPNGIETYQSNIDNVLKRNPSIATVRKQTEDKVRAQKIEQGALDFQIDAGKLGGIALVTPRDGGASGYVNAALNGSAIKKKPKGVLDDDRIILTGIQQTGVPTKKNFQQVSADINKLFARPIVKLAKSLYGKLYSGDKISQFAKKLGSLNSSDAGGILPPGAEGQIFEAASKAALTSMRDIGDSFDPKNENRPFDFTESTAMNQILGVKAVRGDSKRGGGDKDNFKNQINGFVVKSLNDSLLGPKIGSQIKQQSIQKGRNPNNAAGGFIPNFVSKTREIGSGAEARFLKLGTKGGIDVGVKKFYKDGPKNALSQEWLISQYINRYLNIPGIYGPKIVSGYNESQRRGGIRKEIIPGLLAKTAVGREKANLFGGWTLRSAVKTKGLDLPDLHGSNYIVNKQATEYINGLSNYPTDAVRSMSALKEMASRGGVASIIDPGFAKLTGSPAIDVVDQMLNYIDSKKKQTAAKGFLPNFAQIKSKKYGTNRLLETDAGSYLEFYTNKYKRAFEVEYIRSLRKGDARAMFSRLADVAKKTKMSIITEELLPQKINKEQKEQLKSSKATNFDKLLKTFPQIRYREIPKLNTKGSFGYDQEEFTSIEQLKAMVNSMSKKDFNQNVKGGITDLESYFAFAKGFLPNFADPLKDAVNREMAAGVPASQIYIDKNSSLKSAANPMGLMVANRRDEPAGGHQGISRAIREGRDPKTYGAASGFVPNYADISEYSGMSRSDAISQAEAKFKSKIEEASNKYSQNIKELDRLNESIKYYKEKIDLLNKTTSDTDKNKAIYKNNIKNLTDDLKADEKIQSDLARENANLLSSKKELGKSLEKEKQSITTASTNKKGKETVVGGAKTQKESKDMLGTIFALQGAFSVLTGYTDGLSGSVGSVIKGLSSMASGVTTAAFAYQGAQRLATESTGVLGKALGKAGVYGAVALGAFEVFKAGKEIYRDVTGKTADAAKATAQFNDAVKNAGISLDSLSETARNQKVASAEGALYNLGFGSEGGLGTAYKDKETQKMYAETQYITGMTEEQIQKYLIQEGATTELNTLINTGRKNENGENIYRQALETDEDKAQAALAKIITMPQKGTKEYDERIKVLAQRKKEQAEIQRDINQAEKDSNKTVEDAKILNAAKVSFLQLQLENRIKYKDALFEAMNAEEYSLSLQKEMLSVGESDRIQADYKLQSLQAAKKATLEQSNATVELLKNSTLITNKLQGAGIGLDEIDTIEFEKIAGVSEKISDLIKKQGGYTQEVANEADKLLGKIVPEKTQREQILKLIEETNGEITKRIDLENKVNALNNLQKAIIEASNLATENSRKSILAEIESKKQLIDLDQKRLDINNQLFKNRAENLKSIAPKGIQDQIDDLINSRERSSVIKSGQNQQNTIFRNLQKELLSTALEKNFGSELQGEIKGASSITELQKLGSKIEDAEKNAAIAKLDAAFAEQKIVLNSAKFFYDTVKKAAQDLALTLGAEPLNYDQLIDKKIEELQAANRSKADPKDIDQIRQELSQLQSSKEADPLGLYDPSRQLLDLTQDYKQQREALQSSSFIDSLNLIESAINEAGIASEETVAKLEELDPSFRNASRKLETQFNKLMLSFSSSMAAKERENIALSGRMERLSMQKDFELQNPANFAGITDPQEYIKKQQQIEKEFFDKNQQLELERITKEAEIQFKTEQMTLENIKQTSANTEALRKLKDALVAMVPLNNDLGLTNNGEQLKTASGDSYDNEHLRKLIAAEVGSQGENAQAAFLATVINRSRLQEKTIDEVAQNKNYYAPLKNQGRFAQTKPITQDQLQKLLQNPNINAPFYHNATNNKAGLNMMRAEGINLESMAQLIGDEWFYRKPKEADIGSLPQGNYFNAPTTDSIDKEFEAIKRLADEKGNLSEASLKAAESLGYTGDAATEKAQQLQNVVEGLKNESEKLKQQQKTFGYGQNIDFIKSQARSFSEGLDEGFLELNKQTANFKYQLGTEIPQMFASNMSDAIQRAIEGGESLGSVLQNVAYNFVKEINSKLISNMTQNIVGSIGNAAGGASGISNFFQFAASGGPITGGSGTKDDVPAMLMGGEYVINKKSVGKYGPQFLEAINNGTLGGYAKGGRVQSGRGGFFTPGTYGLGGIQGTGNLLKFATQAYTSGSRDQIINQGNYASINLEPESVRLTNFGRANSPQAEATRAAKEQAFGLYMQEMQAQAEAKKQEEAEKEAFKKQLIMLGITAVGGTLLKSASAGFTNAFAASSNTGFTKFLDGAKGVWSGGAIGGTNFGGLKNLFSGDFAASQIGSVSNLEDYLKNNPKSDLYKSFMSNLDSATAPRALLVDEDKTVNGLFNYNRATGGSIPSAGGIDTVPAMLSGGEFIMNRSAAQNIGASNLQALNAGAGSIVTEEKTEELNEKLISKLDELIEASSAAGNITINVDGSTGKSSQTTDGGASEQKQQLARQIKDVVLKVIQDEKRLGGSLRK
jgi:TP901 family phage tail tape measure protein